MSFNILDKIENASLGGFPLMLVMLAAFLVGAVSMRLAIEFDAKALWDAIRRNQKTDHEEPTGGVEHE